ncbi:unnamed protein product [Nippostrongylus brasiliensis]|uniref:Cwf21 domain-containing protein n=1 Tax=Nippostrongylus brasiliensis TaxID=27835 RepID=A0A0N4Y6V4_NIPBR|nr:unnamed protein product [Nippostrongylus brasiliensis]
MYNGIGLQTARGTGTNGYVQANLSNLLLTRKRVEYNSEADLKRAEAEINRAPNEDILQHQRKRVIEMKCAEFEMLMEEKACRPYFGFDDDEIQKKVSDYRNLLLGQLESGELNLDAELGTRDSHARAKAAVKNRDRMRSALGLGDDFVPGASMKNMKKSDVVGAALADPAVTAGDSLLSSLKKEMKEKTDKGKKKRKRKESSSSSSSSSSDSSGSSDSSEDSSDDSSSEDSDGSSSDESTKRKRARLEDVKNKKKSDGRKNTDDRDNRREKDRDASRKDDSKSGSRKEDDRIRSKDRRDRNEHRCIKSLWTRCLKIIIYGERPAAIQTFMRNYYTNLALHYSKFSLLIVGLFEMPGVKGLGTAMAKTHKEGVSGADIAKTLRIPEFTVYDNLVYIKEQGLRNITQRH